LNVSHLVSSYGYWAVFVLVLIESLGVPLPGETALIIAGTYAGDTHKLSPWLIFASAAAAAIAGNCIGYWIGDKGGYPLALRYGSKIRLDERKLKVARYLFDRQGTKVVFFGRFVSILRTYVAFLAGTSRMRLQKFLAASVASAIVWAAIYTVASYFAGRALERNSATVSLILGILAVVIIVVIFLVLRNQTSKLADRAEAAYPGPLDGHPGAPRPDRDRDRVSEGEAEARADRGSGPPTTSRRPGRRG
jgi:membrane protein DedA with SNARE-associated domain